VSDTATPRPDITDDRIRVTVGGDDYEFRIPSIRFDIEVGYRSRAIRRAAAPAEGGDISGLDWFTINFTTYCAIMELYLVATSAPDHWPFTADAAGKPVVDSAKFPLRKRNTVMEVGGAFNEAFIRFCNDGVSDGHAAGTETVDGGKTPGT